MLLLVLAPRREGKDILLSCLANFGTLREIMNLFVYYPETRMLPNHSIPVEGSQLKYKPKSKISK